MKKVLIVITTGFRSTGGLTTVMMNYWRNMNRESLLIDFASNNEPDDALLKEIESEGGEYFKLPRRGKWLIPYMCQLWRLSKNYDIVHVNGNSATSFLELIVAKWAGVDVRLVHNHNSETAHPLLNKLLMPLFRKSYTRALACSEQAGDWLFGVCNKDYIILKNAIDVKRFQYSSEIRKKIRKDFGFVENDFIVGHVGKMVEAKNHEFLLQFFGAFNEKYPNSKLLLVGTGVLSEKLKIMVNDLGIKGNVMFLGIRTDVADLLQVMDGFVFPSIHEGLPLSVLEAQASGLPCFISDRITKEVMVSPYIHALSIEDTPASWAEYIKANMPAESRENVCRTNAECITNAGYNIETEAGKLRDIYLRN